MRLRLPLFGSVTATPGGRATYARSAGVQLATMIPEADEPRCSELRFSPTVAAVTVHPINLVARFARAADRSMLPDHTGIIATCALDDRRPVESRRLRFASR